MKRVSCAAFSMIMALLLSACDSGQSHQDLHDFMAETKRRPQGQIEPLPAFRPYRPFTYSAMTLRSPFDKPVSEEISSLRGGRTVEPDLNREREYLESFNIATITMVGSLLRSGELQVLLSDGEGGVHRVSVGNYIGRSHGKIVAADSSHIEVLEIVSDGASGWVERPKIIKLEEKE